MGYASVLKPGLFEGQTIIVTGAGSGIGRCTAHELASLGARVILTGRKEDKLKAVAAEIAEDGGEAHYLSFDIRNETAVQEAIANVVRRFGPIQGLVNNAGGQYPAPMSTISKKGFEAVVSTNLTGGFLMMREVFTQSMEHHGGAIVNMAADMRNGMPGMAHSGAARAGMINLTMTAAYEWAPAGVRVNCVGPGWIMSSGMDTYDGAVRAIIPLLKKHVPMSRLGTEAEVSGVICFLLSPAAAFVTGETVRIDGGAPLGNALYPLPEHDSSPAFNGFHRAVLPDALKEDE